MLRVFALSLMVAHLVSVALASSPAFHHWFHGDADNSDHVCAVTSLLDGQLDCMQAGVYPVGVPEENRTDGDLLRPQAFPLGFLPSPPEGRAPPAA